jgi:hypothetical protein
MTVRALTKVDYLKLAEILEASLKNLGYTYYKNQGREVTEFEVRSPCQFIASVEGVTSQRLGFIFLRPLAVESVVEIRRMIGSKGSEAELLTCVSALVRELRSALPKEPWKGTGFFRSRAERTRWERLDEL